MMNNAERKLSSYVKRICISCVVMKGGVFNHVVVLAARQITALY